MNSDHHTPASAKQWRIMRALGCAPDRNHDARHVFSLLGFDVPQQFTVAEATAAINAELRRRGAGGHPRGHKLRDVLILEVLSKWNNCHPDAKPRFIPPEQARKVLQMLQKEAAQRFSSVRINGPEGTITFVEENHQKYPSTP